MVVTVTQIPTLARRPRDGHKGTFGTVLVVAGSDSMLGAAILCARGALRGGAGLVSVCVPSHLQALMPLAVPCATTLAREGAPERWLDGATAVAMGPGLGRSDATRALVAELLRAATVPIVLDADALNVLAPLGQPLTARAPLVLTPHPGEAARLLGWTKDDVQKDRRAAALALAAASGQIAVLKGAGTLVTDGARLFSCRSGNPGMATGGSGDVLAGLLGALLAQGMLPFDAACLGVHVHGLAGDLVAERLSEPGLTAEDLPPAIAEVLGS